MKCTGKGISVFSVLVFSCVLLTGCQSENTVAKYEAENYNNNLYEGHLYAEDLCVSKDDVEIEDFTGDSSLHAAGLFNIDDKTVDYAYNIHEKIYPASTTKILTALTAMELCDMDETVTVSQDAAASSFDIEAQVCGLQEGDQISMEALLNGLLLHSGNDNAVAIAEYAGDGSVEDFVNLMNKKAEELLQNLDIGIPDVTVPVGNLSGGQRQGVAVARLVNRGGKVFIFDEPTAAMGLNETNAVLKLIRRLALDGYVVIVISHNMPQVFDISDRICIMRQGRVIGEMKTCETTMDEVVSMITGAKEKQGQAGA